MTTPLPSNGMIVPYDSSRNQMAQRNELGLNLQSLPASLQQTALLLVGKINELEDCQRDLRVQMMQQSTAHDTELFAARRSLNQVQRQLSEQENTVHKQAERITELQQQVQTQSNQMDRQQKDLNRQTVLIRQAQVRNQEFEATLSRYETRLKQEQDLVRVQSERAAREARLNEKFNERSKIFAKLREIDGQLKTAIATPGIAGGIIGLLGGIQGVILGALGGTLSGAAAVDCVTSLGAERELAENELRLVNEEILRLQQLLNRPLA